MTQPVRNAVIGVKRMGVILWCVTAIVAIVFLHLHYAEDMGAPSITAMTLIAAMAGVDVWKQGRSGNAKE
jgi:phosphate/sulfate permease